MVRLLLSENENFWSYRPCDGLLALYADSHLVYNTMKRCRVTRAVHGLFRPAPLMSARRTGCLFVPRAWGAQSMRWVDVERSLSYAIGGASCVYVASGERYLIQALPAY